MASQLAAAIVKDGKDDSESILTIETNGALTAEETVGGNSGKVEHEIEEL